MSFGIIEMAPYAYSQKDGEIGGYYPPMVDALMQDSQVPYELVMRPLKRLIAEIKSQKLDCVFIARTHVSESILTMVAPTGEDLKAGILPKKGVKLDRYEDLYALNVGVALGVSFNPRFDKDDKITKMIAPNYDSLTTMMLRDRVDAASGNIDSFYHFAREQGADPKEEFGEPLIYMQVPVWVGCRPELDGSEEVERIRASAEKLAKNYTFTRLIHGRSQAKK